MDKPRILICDDSLIVRRNMKDLLENAGAYEVLEAAYGREALEVFRSRKPDLVLLDIVMPGMDGIAVLEEMRKIDPKALVVMVSSTGTQSNLRRAVDAGAADFLQKPFEPEKLLELVRKVLEA